MILIGVGAEEDDADGVPDEGFPSEMRIVDGPGPATRPLPLALSSSPREFLSGDLVESGVTSRELPSLLPSDTFALRAPP